MNSKKRFVFLILHYQNMEYTKKCVSSIVSSCKKSNYKIIIVDNNSPNKTGETLKEMYNQDSNIVVILSRNNLGFSGGNNIGLKYINDNYEYDFIVMINNDVEIIDEKFCEIITEEYNKFNFHVMGPKVYLKDGSVDQYPFEPMTKKALKKQIRNFSLYLVLCKAHLHKILRIILDKRKRRNYRSVDKTESRVNVVLSGCALIFSASYFEKYYGINDKTFLYKEEQLLYHRLMRSNMTSLYSPRTYVLHNEGVSTNTMYKALRNKMIMYYQNQLKSGRILLNYINDNNQR